MTNILAAWFLENFSLANFLCWPSATFLWIWLNDSCGLPPHQNAQISSEKFKSCFFQTRETIDVRWIGLNIMNKKATKISIKWRSFKSIKWKVYWILTIIKITPNYSKFPCKRKNPFEAICSENDLAYFLILARNGPKMREMPTTWREKSFIKKGVLLTEIGFFKCQVQNLRAIEEGACGMWSRLDWTLAWVEQHTNSCTSRFSKLESFKLISKPS